MKKDKLGKIYYKEKDLINELQSMKAEGKGTREDPFIIEKPFQLPEKTVISKSSLHINFIHQDFQGLGLYESQNIKFEECSFIILDITRSTQIKVTNCSIKNFILIGGNDDDFIDCEINDVPRNILSYNNRFINCKLSEEVKSILCIESVSFSLNFIPQILFIMDLILGISFLSSIFTSLFGIWDWFSVIIFGGGFFGVGILFLYVRKVLSIPKEKNENQIINNGKLKNT